MKKLLVVVDVQNDFVDGVLGSAEAKAIIPAVIDKITSWDGDIVATQDTHTENYLETREGIQAILCNRNQKEGAYYEQHKSTRGFR